MKKCPTCGTENFDNAQYCDECGAMMSSGSGDFGGDANQKAESSERENFNSPMTEAPIFQSSSATSIEISPSSPFVAASSAVAEAAPVAFETESGARANSSAESEKTKGVHAILTVERGDAAGRQFALVAGESYIGRWDADNGVFPDIDLDKHDPEAKISRRHARIRFADGAYSIEDLGSTNGTFVNRGRRLVPGVGSALKDGDEIIVGKTFLRFNVNR